MTFTFGQKVTLQDSRDFTPVFAPASDNYIYMSWTGRDARQSISNKNIFEDVSVAVPSLAWMGNQLMLSWTGTEPQNHCNVAQIVVYR